MHPAGWLHMVRFVMAEMDRNKRRPPTGPIASSDAEERTRRRLKERFESQQEDTPTRQIDTKPLVSAAFEDEQEPAEELGFDRPLLVNGATPDVSPLSFEPAAQDARPRRKSNSVLVDMDFEEDSQEHTPTSLWRDKPAANASAAPQHRPTSPSQLRPATGPHRPRGLTPGATAELLSRKPSGSARRRHRSGRSTAQLPRQRSSSSGRGAGSGVIIYVLIGVGLGLALGLYFGLRRAPAPTKAADPALSAASKRAIARVESRRELSATDRAGLVKVRGQMDAGRWFAASQAFVRLPERLRKEVAVGYWQGRMLAAQGRHQAAAKLLRRLLARAPAASWRVELGVELSEVLLAAGRRKEALAAVRKARLELDADASEELASRIVRQLRRCTAR